MNILSNGLQRLQENPLRISEKPAESVPPWNETPSDLLKRMTANLKRVRSGALQAHERNISTPNSKKGGRYLTQSQAHPGRRG